MQKTIIRDCVLLCGDAFEMDWPKCQAIISDPPYSERTHRGHDASVDGHRQRTVCVRKSKNGKVYDRARDQAARKKLGYGSLSEQQVKVCVEEGHAACDGWMVWMTDHTLAPTWIRAMQFEGRYVFAPLPHYAPGSRVRLGGDGPSSWTDWIIVSRTAAQARWGTLPGGYVPGQGFRKHERMGGKPVGLMRDLVKDYSRPGDVILDPFMGAGTTALGCILTGRKFVGMEIDEEAFQQACKRIEDAYDAWKLFDAAAAASLFDS